MTEDGCSKHPERDVMQSLFVVYIHNGDKRDVLHHQYPICPDPPYSERVGRKE